MFQLVPTSSPKCRLLPPPPNLSCTGTYLEASLAVQGTSSRDAGARPRLRPRPGCGLLSASAEAVVKVLRVDFTQVGVDDEVNRSTTLAVDAVAGALHDDRRVSLRTLDSAVHVG